ncbi:HNH endonuclease signature motif containing protein, partial [Frankia sp. EI5c]|uniref:HNH endonuclease signature motif containing protein n=1 Tax=Frankia sp. EI5c TaxID=683316 RepID=UPI001F5BD954
TGRTEHGKPFSCEVQVVVPVGVLLGLSSEPGEIPGVGPIPAAIAREMAERPGSTWRRLLTDPQGHLLEVGDRRFPTPAQARHVQARDRTCRMPGCARRARRCDLDHTVPHSQGGKTVIANLGPLCRRHHRLRHSGPWRISQPRPGVFRWVTTLGHEVTVTPHTYLDPPLPCPRSGAGDAGHADSRAAGLRPTANRGWPEYDAQRPPF